jgi:hypothetical protein
MDKTYSYDPSSIDDAGVNQMRFELGDTAVESGEQTCAMCDEEYRAIINKVLYKEKRSWNYAKLYCLQGLLMQFAHEVNYSADGMSISLSERYERWKDMYFRLQKSLAVPTANKAIIGKNAPDGGHYFYAGMNDNPRVTSGILYGYNEKEW